MQAQGSGLTNKYAEGYPGKRYYGGCEHVDKVEQLAIDRARQLFGADYANVQPHSGSSANAAVYLALLNAGDTILGMSLAHGGHLTHGAKVSSSGKLYNAVQYGLDTATGLIDYDEVERLAVEHKPKMIVAGFSAYSKTLDFPRFRAIADKVGALLFVDMAHVAGLVAAGLYPNPIPFADVVTTTTHKTLRGPRGGLILARANEEIEKKLNSAVFPGAQGGPGSGTGRPGRQLLRTGRSFVAGYPGDFSGSPGAAVGRKPEGVVRAAGSGSVRPGIGTHDGCGLDDTACRSAATVGTVLRSGASVVPLATGAGKRGLPYSECLAPTRAAGRGCLATQLRQPGRAA